MTSNEIARKLQALLSEYEARRHRIANRTDGAMAEVSKIGKEQIAESTAGHFLATDIGDLITDIDAENERTR